MNGAPVLPDGSLHQGGQLLHNLLLFGRMCRALGMAATPNRNDRSGPRPGSHRPWSAPGCVPRHARAHRLAPARPRALRQGLRSLLAAPLRRLDADGHAAGRRGRPQAHEVFAAGWRERGGLAEFEQRCARSEDDGHRANLERAGATALQGLLGDELRRARAGKARVGAAAALARLPSHAPAATRPGQPHRPAPRRCATTCAMAANSSRCPRARQGSSRGRWCSSATSAAAWSVTRASSCTSCTLLPPACNRWSPLSSACA